MKIKTQLRSILALSVLGWLNSFYTLWHRNKLLLNGLDSKSFCNVNSFVNCDSVALSSYSSFLGFPTAAYGMLFYALVIVLALWISFSQSDGVEEKVSDGALLLLILNIVGIVPTLGLSIVSLTKLNALCLMCLVTYVINGVLLILSFALLANARRRQAPSFLRGLGSLGAVTWILASIVSAAHFAAPALVDDSVGSGAKMDPAMIRLYVARYASGKVQSFDLADLPTRGAADAPISVVEFSDFQCPFCARSAATMPVLLKAYEGQIRYSYKNFPLSSECNAGMKSINHAQACLAAKAGWCVFKAKGSELFFKFKEELFAQQDKLSPSVIEATAKQNGVDESELKTCLSSPATQDVILRQTAEGQAKGVAGTPAIFVNGRLVESGPQPLILRAVFDSLLLKK